MLLLKLLIFKAEDTDQRNPALSSGGVSNQHRAGRAWRRGRSSVQTVRPVSAVPTSAPWSG